VRGPALRDNPTASVPAASAGYERSGRYVDAVVIGAGPYGLATTSFLRERGLSVSTIGTPMQTWRERMPHGMYLKSTPLASSIAAPDEESSLADFGSATGAGEFRGHRPVPIESFIRYGLWFKDRHVPDLRPGRVEWVTRHGSTFVVTLDGGEEILSSNVVVATGLTSAAHMPSELSSLRSPSPHALELASHSSEHQDLSRLAGKRVAVIGAGQSALESAALLCEGGAAVEIFARAAVIRFAARPGDINHHGHGTPLKPESLLGPGWSLLMLSRMPGGFRHLPPQLRLRLVATILGPSGAWWLQPRLDGRIAVHVAHRLERATRAGSHVVLTFVTRTGERRTATYDHVIAATGYRVSVDALTFLDPAVRRDIELTAGSWPALGGSFNSSIPGLYFTGPSAAATFGPVMRFVCGTRFAARQVSLAIAWRCASTRRRIRRVTEGEAAVKPVGAGQFRPEGK
jgi:pyridine nucleotide-disulfide oxidoreductase